MHKNEYKIRLFIGPSPCTLTLSDLFAYRHINTNLKFVWFSDVVVLCNLDFRLCYGRIVSRVYDSFNESGVIFFKVLEDGFHINMFLLFHMVKQNTESENRLKCDSCVSFVK